MPQKVQPSNPASSYPEHGRSVPIETRGGTVVVSEPGITDAVPIVCIVADIVKNVKALRDTVAETVETEGDFTAIGFGILSELRANPAEYIDQIVELLAFFTDKDAAWFLDRKNVALSDFLALMEGAAQVVPFERYMQLFNRTMERFKTVSLTSTPSSDSDADTAEPTLTDSDSTELSDSPNE